MIGWKFLQDIVIGFICFKLLDKILAKPIDKGVAWLFEEIKEITSFALLLIGISFKNKKAVQLFIKLNQEKIISLIDEILGIAKSSFLSR
ncbi:MAG: hypothetical protein KAV40_01440 [Thermoplasmatales archaeon]|nr:hypothetical protein [Thermoplasmatales archaeon]